MTPPNTQSPWHAVTPPLDYVPITPVPPKSIKRALIAPALFLAWISGGTLFVLAIAAIAVLGVFLWLLRTLAANAQWLIVLVAVAFIVSIIFNAPH